MPLFLDPVITIEVKQGDIYAAWVPKTLNLNIH
jgi:hypothetical protein